MPGFFASAHLYCFAFQLLHDTHLYAAKKKKSGSSSLGKKKVRFLQLRVSSSAILTKLANGALLFSAVLANVTGCGIKKVLLLPAV